MAEKDLSFKTAFKKFYTSNSKPDDLKDNKAKLDQETRENLEKLKLLEQKRVDRWERDKNVRRLYASMQRSESYQYSPEGASNEITLEKQNVTKGVCYSLYICFLSKKTSEQTIISYFQKYGPVHECCIERTKKGISKGYGYVTFGDTCSVEVAYSSPEVHILDGRIIKCNPIRSSKKPYRGRQIFISMPYSLLQSDVKAYLERFARGKVDVFVKGENAQNSTKYGSATFKDSSLVHRFLNAVPHYIEDVRLHAAFHREKSNETLVSRKLHLLNLSPYTTDNSLKEYFGKYGELDSCVVILWKNMLRSTLTGYLIFQWTAAVDAVVMQERHVVDGSPVTIIQPKEIESESEDSRLLIVKRLDLYTREDHVLYHFEIYGEIDACVIERDEDGKSNGTCYVVFERSESLRKALEDAPHTIDYKSVICYPRIPMRDIKLKQKTGYTLRSPFDDNEGWIS